MDLDLQRLAETTIGKACSSTGNHHAKVVGRFVSIPEETLAQLLKEAGRTESVEQFLNTGENRRNLALGIRFQWRSNAAYWSQWWLLLSALVTWSSVVYTPDFEGILSAILLTGMTVVEHTVHLWFKQGDERAITWGWWNQCLFAFLFFVYGFYHGTWDPMPASVNDAVGFLGDDASRSIAEGARITYYAIGLVAGSGQFLLACYYATAKRNLPQ